MKRLPIVVLLTLFCSIVATAQFVPGCQLTGHVGSQQEFRPIDKTCPRNAEASGVMKRNQITLTSGAPPYVKANITNVRDRRRSTRGLPRDAEWPIPGHGFDSPLW